MKKKLLILAISFLLLSCGKENHTLQKRAFDSPESRASELYILTIDQSKSFEPRRIEGDEIEQLIKNLESQERSFDLSVFFIRSPSDERTIQYRYSPPTIKKGNDLETRRLNANAKRRFNSSIVSKRNGFLNQYKQINDLPRSQYTDLFAMSDFLQTKVQEPRYRKSKVNIFAYTDAKLSLPNSRITKIPLIEFDRGNVATFTAGMPQEKNLFKRNETRLTSIQSFIDNLNFKI